MLLISAAAPVGDLVRAYGLDVDTLLGLVLLHWSPINDEASFWASAINPCIIDDSASSVKWILHIFGKSTAAMMDIVPIKLLMHKTTLDGIRVRNSDAELYGSSPYLKLWDLYTSSLILYAAHKLRWLAVFGAPARLCLGS